MVNSVFHAASTDLHISEPASWTHAGSTITRGPTALNLAAALKPRPVPTLSQTHIWAAASPLEIENLTEIIEDFKMVLVVRNDLKMGKGTIAAQCSHATLGLFKRLQQRAPKSLRRWEQCGQVKVVVKIESEEDMLVLQVYFPIEQDVGNEATIAF